MVNGTPSLNTLKPLATHTDAINPNSHIGNNATTHRAICHDMRCKSSEFINVEDISEVKVVGIDHASNGVVVRSYTM